MLELDECPLCGHKPTVMVILYAVWISCHCSMNCYDMEHGDKYAAEQWNARQEWLRNNTKNNL